MNHANPKGFKATPKVTPKVTHSDPTGPSKPTCGIWRKRYKTYEFFQQKLLGMSWGAGGSAPTLTKYHACAQK